MYVKNHLFEAAQKAHRYNYLMNENPIPLKDLLPEKVEIDITSISAYTREGQFTSLAVELLKETAILTSLLAGTHQLEENNNPRRWTRNEAVLAGLMVRLSKLQRGFLDQACQHRREIADIIFRPLVENIVNLTFLLTKDDPALVEEYIEYSLRTEKRLLIEIEDNIKEQGFELPIEQRMKASIMRVFEQSGFAPEMVDENNFRPWGGNIKKRARTAGMEEGYLSIMGLPSHAIHGNWQDLITHHLEYENGEFSPKTEWTQYRPQGIFAVASYSVMANSLYARKAIPQTQEAEEIETVLSDLMVRIKVANELHEQFLQNKGS